MNFQKIVCIAFINIVFLTASFAQVSNKIKWSVDDDLLPQNSVKSIVPDKYGYIWLSTENGLVRYDGRDYKIYNSQNLNLNSNRMLYIQGNSSKDSLYISTDYENDFLLINQRQAKVVDRKKFPIANDFKITSNDYYNSYGVFPYKAELLNKNYKILLPSLDFYLIKKDTFKFYSKKKSLIAKVYCKNPNTRFIFSLGEKLFYIENNSQYAEFNKNKLIWKKLNFKINADFKVIWNKTCQQVFIQSENNLYRIEDKNNKLQATLIIQDLNLKNSNITTAYQDNKNNIIFLGSSTNGLGVYKKGSFKTITVFDDNQSQVFYALHKESETSIISSSGFSMNKDSIIKNYHFSNQEKSAMAIDKNQNIWLKSNYQLFYYQKKNNLQNPQIWNFKDKIGTLFQDSKKRIWISLEGQNVSGSKLSFFIPNEKPEFRNFSVFPFRINYIHENHDGELWLSTTKGLYLLDVEKKTLKLIKDTSNLNIRSILQTEKNEIWITTYESGFYLSKNNKLTKLPLDKNGFLATSHFIMEDANGFFWIATNKGLFQVKKQALLSYAKNPVKTIYYQYYDKNSGFLTNEFNGGTSPYGVKLGSQFFIPSMNGVVTFDTNKINPLQPTNPIYIDNIIVDNKNYKVSNTLNLPNSYERVTFQFSSPYFGNELNANYEIKLEGPNALGWTSLASNHEYSFTKLSPGSYILTARKVSGFDSTYIIKKIHIVIAHKFYETNLFIVIILLITMLFIYFFSKLYLKKMRSRNKQLKLKIDEKTKDLQNTIGTLRVTKDNMKKQADKNNKLIQIISHDIKSPLKFMSMASKYMYDDFDPNSPDLKENILAMHTSSSQIYNFLDNILSYSKVNTADGELENEQFLLYEEIRNKIRFFKNIANAQKTQLINSIPTTLKLNTNKSLFAIIIHNLLDNALKHTSFGTIEFSALQKEDEITITIKDQGQGMNLETLHYYQSVIDNFDLHKNKSNKKLGLHLVIELMLILNGKITLNSELEKGTSVSLHFNNQIEIVSS
jgi:signal transduction histidine kinase/ligand-binding sensor domain-containing protein